MDTKEIKITPPKGFEIDKENSTFDCIKFKPIEKKRWRDDESKIVSGYFILPGSEIAYIPGTSHFMNKSSNRNIFATEKQAKSALAMARISQIMANDKRFGGIITDEEWKINSIKHCIGRCKNKIFCYTYDSLYYFLSFHTAEQRALFLEENEDLVRDYLML